MTIAMLNSSLYLSSRAKLAGIYFCCKGLTTSVLNPTFKILHHYLLTLLILIRYLTHELYYPRFRSYLLGN